MDDDRLDALNEAVLRFGKAWARGETVTLARLLSPSYVHTDIYGACRDRTAWLAYAAERGGRTTRIDFRDLSQRIVGDVAIVTGINEIHGHGARHAEDRSSLTLRFTQVWVWRHGEWLREVFQATAVDPEADVMT